MTTNPLNLPIIGIHRSPLLQKFGTPRQSNLVAIDSVIEFYSPFDTPCAFVGIERYSHLWVLWHFHHNHAQDSFRPQVRPPRLGGNDKLGVFATRSMYRPSPIGLSVVQLLAVIQNKNSIRLNIRGADMIDGTPIVDIKPYLPYSDSLAYATGFDKPSQQAVLFSQQALAMAQSLHITDTLETIGKLISYDPRPAYKADDNSTFVMRYQAPIGAIDVLFYWQGDKFVIDDFQKVAAVSFKSC